MQTDRPTHTNALTRTYIRTQVCTHTSVYLCLPACLPARLPACLSARLSCLSVCLYVFNVPMSQRISFFFIAVQREEWTHTLRVSHTALKDGGDDYQCGALTAVTWQEPMKEEKSVGRSQTLVDCLEGSYANRYTTDFAQ